MEATHHPPLHGLLIADLTRAVSGPFATMLLGDLGARIIKIEEEGSGDETRQWGPPFLDDISAYYLSMNRNKESIALNLKRDRDRRLLSAILSKADVLIENFRPGVMDRLGFAYDELAQANPRLIYASISGFGPSGPERLRPGYDLILQAMSGLMHVSAGQGEPPVKVAFPITDILAALFTGKAILAALYAREKSGRGRKVDVSLLEAMLCAMSNLAAVRLLTGNDPPQVGTAQANIVPYQMFRCQDAPIVAGAPNERLWARFCLALGRPQWLEDPRFQGNPARNQHRAELVTLIESVLAAAPAAHWLARFQENEIPCAPVLTVGQALDHPQVKASGSIAESLHPTLGPIRFTANPMRMSDFTPTYNPPPALNQHGDKIFQEFLGQ